MEKIIYDFLREIPPVVWIFVPLIIIVTIVSFWKIIIKVWNSIFKNRKSTNESITKKIQLSRGYVILFSIISESFIIAGIIFLILYLVKITFSIEMIIFTIILVFTIIIVIMASSNVKRLILLSIFAIFILSFILVKPEIVSQIKEQLLLICLTVAGLFISVLSALLVVYFWWAPNNIFFTFVPEGRAKIVVRGNQFEKVIINWKDHILVTSENHSSFADKELWDVVEAKPKKHLFGGLCFYGLFPFEDLYVYDFSWTNIQQDGAIVNHQPEVMDYVLLKEDVYLGEIKQAEDKSLVPTDIKIIVTMKVINPYKALFNVQNWLETIMNRIKAAVRNAFTENTYEKWISEDEDLAEVIKRKLEDFLTDVCNGDYGVEVVAIEVTDINPSEEFRRATTEKFLGEAKAKKIAGEISYTVISMMAETENVTFDEMKEKISKTKKDKQKYQKFCLETFEKKIAAESGSWAKIDVSGGNGTENSLMELFAGILRMPKGNKQENLPKEKTSKKEEESD
jgi:hypothetical protein